MCYPGMDRIAILSKHPRPMKKRFVLILSVFSLQVSVYAQIIPEVYHIDRTPEARICHLPEIYFKLNSAELETSYLEDLAFLAHLMYKNKTLAIRIKPSISPHSGDANHKLLTEERLTYFTWIMEDKFGIAPERIIRDNYLDLSRGYSPDQSTLPIDLRRMECSCVWDKKAKKMQKKKWKQIRKKKKNEKRK